MIATQDNCAKEHRPSPASFAQVIAASTQQSGFVDGRGSHAAQLKLRAIMADSSQSKRLTELQNTASSSNQSAIAQRALILNNINWNPRQRPPYAETIVQAIREIRPVQDIDDVLTSDRTFVVNMSMYGQLYSCYEEVRQEEVQNAAPYMLDDDSGPDTDIHEERVDDDAIQQIDPRFDMRAWGQNQLDAEDDESSDGEGEHIQVAQGIEVGEDPGYIDQIENGICSMGIRGLLSCFAIFIETQGPSGSVQRISGWHFVTPQNGSQVEGSYALNDMGASRLGTLVGHSAGGRRRALIGFSGEFIIPGALDCIQGELNQRGINDITVLQSAGGYEATISSYGTSEYMPD